MKTFYTYTGYTGACKVRNYLNTNKIPFTEWHDIEGGYEIITAVTPAQYDELMNI